MLSLQVLISRSRVSVNVTAVLKRFKSRKEKHAVKAAVKSNAELALNHYDIHLGNIFGPRWPSMRLALLSQPKYCAVMNNFCGDYDTFLYQLAEKGGFDFISRFKALENHSGKYSVVREEEDEKNEDTNGEKEKIVEFENELEKGRSDGMVIGADTSLTSSPSDLLSFVAGERVLSTREALMHSEHQLHHSNSSSIPITPISNHPTTTDSKHSTTPSPNPLVSENGEHNRSSVSVSCSDPFQYHHKLQAILHTKGDLTDFLPAKRDLQTGKLSYYLMDAGSILPILALDLFPGCSVLDMCSAPGGKTFAMLQTMLPGSMICLDRSHSRIVRLKNSIRSFFPHSYSQYGDNRVNVKQRDAIVYASNNTQQFDRVLVDVPCYADRHTLANIDNEDNSLFKSSRQQDRISIQAIQQKLLVAGLKACKPGGTLVYSTCTLFPSQNDVVVRLGVNEVVNEMDMEVEVIDTGRLAEAYEDFFCFEPSWKGKLGQLVVPNMAANFGPTYFCKLRRTR